MCGRVYFSQYGEDVYLVGYFQGKRNGFYVDVGGYHLVHFSNTYAFYRGGWSGVVIEPNPQKLPLFRRHRPRDVTLPLAISAGEGTVEFAIDEGCSGIVDDRYFHTPRLDGMRRIAVPTRPLAAVLDEHVPAGQSIDILSVDCEGHDEVVLRSNDWERHRPLVALCEAFDAGSVERLSSLMQAVGYRHLATCGPTLLFEDGGERERPPAYH